MIGSQGIQHRLSRGEFRENELAELLRPYIPERFGLGSGEVVNSSGQISRQQDVLITDSVTVAPFIVSGRLGVYPIEAIVASLQVKSRLDAGELTSAIANLTSMKQLLPIGPRPVTRVGEGMIGMGVTTAKPFTAVVAYSAGASVASLIRTLAEASRAQEPPNRTNLVFVLDAFVATWGAADGKVELDPHGPMHLQIFEAGEDSVLVFYAMLSHWLQRYQPPRLDLLAYVNSLGLDMQHWVASLDESGR
jgi:hypothetical protein